jgi:hypothetical protein
MTCNMGNISQLNLTFRITGSKGMYHIKTEIVTETRDMEPGFGFFQPLLAIQEGNSNNYQYGNWLIYIET